MSFLETAFLAGLVGAAIPIAIHLLHRGKSRKVRFPSLRFLKEVEVRTARRKRVEEWVILAVRAGILALLALALARPVVRGTIGAGGQASRVVVIDDSMSMGARGPGGTALERSVLFARGLLSRSSAADRMAILPLHGEPTPLTESRKDCEEALAAIRPTFEGSPILPAIERAVEILADEKSSSREILVLSDFQASALADVGGPLGAWTSKGAGMTLVLLRPAVSGGANAAVAGAEIADRSGTLRARVLAHGGEALTRLRLSIDGTTVAERSVRAGAGQEAAVTFRLPDLPAGLHRATIRADEDVLPADNELEVALDARPPPRVVVARDADRAGGPRDPAFYVARALASGGGSRRATAIDLLTTGELTPARLASADVVFLLEPSSISPALGAALGDLLRRGGGVFVAAGPALSLDPSASPAEAAPWLPAAVGPVVRAGDEPTRFAAWEERHPIWAPLVATVPRLRPEAAAFLAYRKLDPREGSSTIASFAGGDPALVARGEGSGRVVLFASTVTEGWTSFPLRFAFAPWVQSTLAYLAPAARSVESAIAGSRIVVRHDASSEFRSVRVEPPGGSVRVVAAAADPRTPPHTGAAAAGPTLSADLGELARPGIWVLTEEIGSGSTTRVVSVVPPAEESAIAPSSDARLREILPRARLLELAGPSEAVSRVLAITTGSELKTTLLLILLGMLLVEPFLANRTAYRRGAPSEHVATAVSRPLGISGPDVKVAKGAAAADARRRDTALRAILFGRPGRPRRGPPPPGARFGRRRARP